MGGRGHPLTSMLDMSLPHVLMFICSLLLQLVPNVLVCLIFGGIPKASHEIVLDIFLK